MGLVGASAAGLHARLTAGDAPVPRPDVAVAPPVVHQAGGLEATGSYVSAGHGPVAADGAGGAATTSFSSPVVLPQSNLSTEPSLVVDPHGTIVVSGPTGGVDGRPTAPVWISRNGGSSFEGPVTTATVASADPTPVACESFGGGDADLVLDSTGYIYQANLHLSLDNSSVAMSADGEHWTGFPIGHVTPPEQSQLTVNPPCSTALGLDDRPWLAYSPADDAMYLAWDDAGGGNITVARAPLRGKLNGTTDSLVFTATSVAVPESVRECPCPVSGIAADPTGGIWIVYPDKNDVGVAVSRDQGKTWTRMTIPGSGTATGPTGGGFASISSVLAVFQGIAVDRLGNVYVTWAVNDGTVAPAVYYSWLAVGSPAFHAPVEVSTTTEGLMPRIAVVSPGVVDIAYYGTGQWQADPQTAPTSANWGIYMAQTRDGLGSAGFVTGLVASPVHFGPVCLSGFGCVLATPAIDRNLGDFFSLAVDPSGMADIVSETAIFSVVPLPNGSRIAYNNRGGVAFFHQSGPLKPITAAARPVGALPPPATLAPAPPQAGPPIAGRAPLPSTAPAPTPTDPAHKVPALPASIGVRGPGYTETPLATVRSAGLIAGLIVCFLAGGALAIRRRRP